MIKILHSADWHLDAPLGGFSPGQREFLRRSQLEIPDKIADLAAREACDICLLAGDLFDGPYTRESFDAVYRALERMEIPVFIAPGNHDFISSKSPWARELFPENVHIFRNQSITSEAVPGLDCRVYGAGFEGMDCPGLLENFHADCQERYALLVLHADPTSVSSPYCPVTAAQIRDAGFDYAALGHIHAAGRFSAGAAMCAWPGCPMGRGWDETGVKGVLITELEESATIRFVPLDTPRFFAESVPAGVDPVASVESLLPPGGSRDFYRIRLTGEVREPVDRLPDSILDAYPNLILEDRTVRAQDLWENAGADSLEGIYFRILRDAARDQDDETVRTLELAARISRQILRGQEVELP